MIDEADKLLDQHFNQWLPKILSSVKTDKTKGESQFGGGQRSVSSLRDTMVGLCVSSERLHLMYEDDRRSKVIKITVTSYLLSILHSCVVEIEKGILISCCFGLGTKLK